MILENKAQEEAIHTVDGQMLIIACPGSGKTTTLLRRINYMVTEAKAWSYDGLFHFPAE